jgi:hypothetical protein
LEFTDQDGVTARKKVEIKALPDLAPEVDAEVSSVIRKTPQGYMATVSAFIPMTIKVRDDHGLESVEYVYTLTKMDAQGGEQAMRALRMIQQLVRLTGGPGQELSAAAQLAPLAKEAKTATQGSQEIKRVSLPRFEAALRDARVPQLPLEVLQTKLDKKPEVLPLRVFAHEASAAADPGGFDAGKLNLKVAEIGGPQPRYRMELWVEASDNYVFTDKESPPPQRGVSKEKFTILLVSENELLTEVAKDEDLLYVKLNNTYNNLMDAQKKLSVVNLDLTSEGLRADDFRPKSGRIEELLQTLEKSRIVSDEVHKEYLRILEELKTNKVTTKMIDRVDVHICQPLASLLEKEYEDAKKGFDDFHKALENPAPVDQKIVSCRKAGQEANVRLDNLNRRLFAVLQNMEGLVEINNLIRKLQELQEDEQRQFQVIKELRDEIYRRIIQDLGGSEDKPKDKDK